MPRRRGRIGNFSFTASKVCSAADFAFIAPEQRLSERIKRDTNNGVYRLLRYMLRYVAHPTADTEPKTHENSPRSTGAHQRIPPGRRYCSKIGIHRAVSAATIVPIRCTAPHTRFSGGSGKEQIRVDKKAILLPARQKDLRLAG